MSLVVTSLNSGSNGNCYYIGCGHDAVLVDAGLSCRETEKRMRRLGLKMETVRAIFISHEHGDHIKGIEGIVSKYKLPVYITAPTLHHGKLRISDLYVRAFKPLEPIHIGELAVLAFPKQHDAADPHSFIVTGNGVNVGVFTDIGTPCRHVIEHFKQCHAIFLEANYDDEMLSRGKYPIHLQRRISSDHGHLSNAQALKLFADHRPSFMSHVFLSHLSRDNNDPELVLQMFAAYATTTNITVASRYHEMEVRIISSSDSTGIIPVKKSLNAKPVQISLFS